MGTIVLLDLSPHWRSCPERTLAHVEMHMPRYFFNLTNGIRTVVDADGVQLEDDQAMRLEAVEMVADLRKQSHITGADWSGWRVTVRDQNGCECFELKF